MLLTALIATSIAADYRIDPDHSTLTFTVESALITAKGRFNSWVGSAQMDGDALETLRAVVTVDVASLDTGVRKRDNHLRTSDFFDVSDYPEATFQIIECVDEGEGKLTVAGPLAIKGVTHTVEFPLEVVVASPERYRLRGGFTIDRRRFGILTNPSINPIENLVTVAVDVNLLAVAPPPGEEAEGEAAPAE